MRTEYEQYEWLRTCLSLAVPLRICQLQERGGPNEADYKRAHEFSEELASKGDVLMYGSTQKGEQGRLFDETARAIAVLAFFPGGVDLFGTHWEAK